MGLVELISERTNEELKSVPYLRSIPCKVLEIIDDEKVRVECIVNGAKYILPNYSANPVNDGDSCIVYYTNNTPIGTTGYIGATVGSAKEINPVNKIKEDVSSVIANNSYKVISDIGVRCKGITVVTLCANINVYGSEEGVFQLKLTVNGTDETFVLKQSVTLGNYAYLSYPISLTLQDGDSVINLSCKGNGNITDGFVTICGHGIEQYSRFEPTVDEDYIYDFYENSVRTILYIGDKTRIAMPQTLGDLPIKTIGTSTFNYTDVEGVFIPDGIQEIE